MAKGTRLMKGTGYQITIPKMLKKKCANATCIAAEVDETSAAIIDVIVVPMFAPSVRGYICCRETMSNPTSGVKTEVVTLELCTAMVRPQPIIMEMYPLIAVAFLIILVDAPRSIDFKTMTNPVRQIIRKMMPRRRLIPPDLK
jgi:hypothetical protein